ncbi:MAG: ligase-associated DNA damage response DEXH box helicase [bacterium]|nr:ligase-associated DNA damage response DEXH box helicase [bacterium]
MNTLTPPPSVLPDAPNPILDWFSAQGWTPFAFQREVWDAYRDGESGLIHSPTGTGKTYAAWLGALIEWTAAHPPPYSAVKRAGSVPLTVLWITPLRALAADTAESLRAPIQALELPWTVETRTGDTSATERGRQRRRLPSALVTTPESLSLLLTVDDAPSLFRDLRLVVVDEWHELMGTKRGVQTELALARLRRSNPGLRAWGLSATMGNLDTALRTLLGTADFETGEVKAGRLVRGDMAKPLRIDTILPETIERFPWSGHLGLTLLPQVIAAVEASRTALIFTNTRFQTETWYQAILEARPEWAGEIALHHSSLEKRTREWVEDQLRAGGLRCVVCTSSLDLGVDFPAVERVLQISSPKGAARLLQRAGRSGHQPGMESRVTCVPAHALELLEISAVRQAIQTGQIEDRPALDAPLDVLVQHLVTIGIGGGFDPDDLYREVRTAYTYRALSPAAWAWALDFVGRGGAALQGYPQYTRLRQADDGRYVVSDAAITRVHRMSIGTIMGDTALDVQYLRGGKIGTLEESFVSRLKPGDRFTLAGTVLEFVRLHALKVWVRKARSQRGKGLVPRWMGGGLPLSDQLTAHIRARLALAKDGHYPDAEMIALRPVLDVQSRLSVIPGSDQLLVESLRTREGHHLFCFPFEGRFVHEGLAALTAYRLSRHVPITFTLAANEYGFELLSDAPAPLADALDAGLFGLDNLLDDIWGSMNVSEMARRQFREIARVAGLVMQRFPGGSKTAKQMQASSGLIYDVLTQYDPHNLLIDQARREVLQNQLEQSRLYAALARIGAGGVLVREVRRPTPFAFPLLVDRLRQTVSSETLEERIRKMQLSYEKW